MSKETTELLTAALLKVLAQNATGNQSNTFDPNMSTTKAVSSTANATYGHGSGGVFNRPGTSAEVANAMVLPQYGLQSRLPWYPTRETNPIHAIFTGVTNLTDGNKPNGPCDDAPTPGLMKLCTQTYVFGRQSMMTPVFDITRVGEIVNRSEPMDFNLVGGIGNNNSGAPTLSGPADFNGALRGEMKKQNLELFVSWTRENGKLIYTGSPANNTGGGGYKEYRGLDTLVNTGYIDSETTQACKAADSVIYNFGSENISTSTTAATALVNRIIGMHHYLRMIDDETGLSPVSRAIVMHPSLFYEVTKIWPIVYNTVGATAIAAGQTNTNLNVDARSVVGDRDAFRTGSYLLIDGEAVPVIQDAFVSRGNSSGTFTNSIYFIPLTVLGGTPATYMEFFDFSGPNGALEAGNLLAGPGTFDVSGGGRFLWVHKPVTNYCVQSQVVDKTRLRLDFPHLAARITNVAYTPLYGGRSPFPSDADFYNGGRTTSTAPSLWAPNVVQGA